MKEDDPNRLIIEKYFEDIEKRIAYLDELVGDNHKDEAFLLCSVYIESLANRYYQNYGRAKGFCSALIELADNKLFGLLHPKQLLNKLEKNKLFNENIDEIKKILEPFQYELLPLDEINNSLIEILTEKQQAWFKNYWFKGSMAMITYERIRCEAVHDMWAPKLSFENTKVNGNPVPDIDYDLLIGALNKIVLYLKETSLNEHNLFLQHNA